MTKILELREKLRNFYGRFEIYVAAGVKFMLALTGFWLVNSRMGYMERLDNPLLVAVLALVCAFLPVNAVIVAGCGLILAHLFALSIAACVVALGLFILMFFLYYKFAPKNGYSTVMTIILCSFRIPQAMPVALGLLKEPASYFSMICATVTFYYVRGVQENVANFTTVEDSDKTSGITVALKALTENKEMFVVIAAFCITGLVVYLIRRQSVDHSWRIAYLTGNAVELVILLTGYILLGLTDQILWIVAGIVVSVIVSMILEFFLYNLDYSRVERVQFEDDEYYYFVKAVPKVYVAEKNKKVKQITPKRTTVSRKELAEELDIDQDLLD